MNTKKLTSRFRRADAPTVEDAGPTKVEASATTEPAKDGVDAPVTATTETKTPEASPETLRPRIARMVEGMRRPGAETADAETPWHAALAARAKPAAIPTAAAAALLLALGIGYGMGHRGAVAGGDPVAVQALGAEMARLAGEVTGVKASLDTAKSERDRGRTEILTRQTQLGEKVERLGQEVAGKVGRLGDQVDKTAKEITRIAALSDRTALSDRAALSDRTEKLERVAATAAATPAPPAKPVAAASAAAAAAAVDVKETGSIAESKPAQDPRKTAIDGYFVRDYDEGFALVETKAGRFIEVAVGHTVPGVGRVEAIERRGRQWVVVTAKGFIGER